MFEAARPRGSSPSRSAGRWSPSECPSLRDSAAQATRRRGCASHWKSGFSDRSRSWRAGRSRRWAARSARRCWRCSRFGRAGWSTSTRSSTACGGRSSRPLRATRCITTSPGCAPRSAGVDRRLRGRLRAGERARGCGALRGAARGDARRAARRRRPCRGGCRRAALALWRGPALQGLTGTAWFGAEARRLEALRVDALEERFEAALALGEHRELVPALARRSRTTPSASGCGGS